MGEQFIAVGGIGLGRMGYSGRADKFSHSVLEKQEVVKVIAPTDKYSATIIFVRV